LSRSQFQTNGNIVVQAYSKLETSRLEETSYCFAAINSHSVCYTLKSRKMKEPITRNALCGTRQALTTENCDLLFPGSIRLHFIRSQDSAT